jgi:hypothetical protein
MDKKIEDMISEVAAGDAPETSFDKALQESSLSRLRAHMLNFDTGMVTAFRSEITEQVEQVPAPEKRKLTRRENMQRNRKLRAELTKKYNVTAVRGKYIENYGTKDAREVGEDVFFVVDAHGTGQLERDLRRLGERYQQDSILFIPRGAESGVLIGTNHTGWPGYGKREKLGHPVFGKGGQFMTKVRGRPFVLEDVKREYLKDYPRGFFGEWARETVIKS